MCFINCYISGVFMYINYMMGVLLVTVCIADTVKGCDRIAVKKTSSTAGDTTITLKNGKLSLMMYTYSADPLEEKGIQKGYAQFSYGDDVCTYNDLMKKKCKSQSDQSTAIGLLAKAIEMSVKEKITHLLDEQDTNVDFLARLQKNLDREGH